MLAVALAAAVSAGAEPPTLREHPIASGAAPVYLDGAWTATNAGGPSAAAGPLNATVPGDILTDLQRAGRTPDPYFNSTWKQPEFVAAWNEGVWTYSTSFDAAALSGTGGATAEHHLLVFDGIRMGAMIALNGQPLGNASDQFLRYVFEVGALLKPAGAQNVLTVAFGADDKLNCDGRWTRSNQIDVRPPLSLRPPTPPHPTHPPGTPSTGPSRTRKLPHGAPHATPPHATPPHARNRGGWAVGAGHADNSEVRAITRPEAPRGQGHLRLRHLSAPPPTHKG